MNQIDLLIVIVIALFTLSGLLKGFIKQVGALIGFFLSLWLASHYYMSAVPWVKPFAGSLGVLTDIAAPVLGFLLILVIAQLLVGVAVSVLDNVVKRLPFIPFLKTVNRSGGALLGLTEGLLIISVVVVMLGKYPFSPTLAQQLTSSQLASPVARIAEVFMPLFPEITKLTPSIFDMKQLPAPSNLEEWMRYVPEKK